MHRSLLSCIAVAFAAGLGLAQAHAGAITDPAAWSTSAWSSWSGAGQSDTVSRPQAGTVDLTYYKGNYFCAGCGRNDWGFSTVLDATGTGSFDYEFSSFSAWYMASAQLGIYLNGILQTSGYNQFSGTETLNVKRGDTLTFEICETNDDGTGFVEGNVALDNFRGAFAVPEPASLSLLGAGLAAAAMLRRRRAG